MVSVLILLICTNYVHTIWSEKWLPEKLNAVLIWDSIHSRIHLFMDFPGLWNSPAWLSFGFCSFPCKTVVLNLPTPCSLHMSGGFITPCLAKSHLEIGIWSLPEWTSKFLSLEWVGTMEIMNSGAKETWNPCLLWNPTNWTGPITCALMLGRPSRRNLRFVFSVWPTALATLKLLF